ncbi:MAG TPA: plastocyanin/azurin family copper-binding protein [Kofleriaceae bacterium]|nr:plastocyanin/azurin family copper-binding protein [Kofleriaceae bacterium]
MSSPLYSRIVALALGTAILIGTAPHAAWSQPRGVKPKPVTQADIERLEKKIADQQRVIEKLIRMQQQYLQSLVALMPDAGGGGTLVVPPPQPDVVARNDPKPAGTKTDAQIDTGPKPNEKPVGKPDPKNTTAKPNEKPPEVKPPAPDKKSGKGTLVGKVKGGGGDTYVYVADVVAAGGGAATMKQEGKQFVPRVMAVQKGTRVEFPNQDAVFHNVFSVTPDNSFDLGSYRQGESKSVTMSKAGVVSVYCNMHPQMVGHILVVPSNLYTRAGADGFYRLPNVPAGKHKIVAWAPNAKPTSMEVEITADEVTTLELDVKRGREAPHLNKDGMPYGSYKD